MEMKKSKSIIHSFKYATEGFISAFKTERNMKMHIFIMICVIIAGILINTAIEITVDLAMPEKNEKAKLAKDIAAAGVFVVSITAAIVGLLIFLPKM